MLEQNYFCDAFILHDQTDQYPFLQMMLMSDTKDKIEFENPFMPTNLFAANKVDLSIDERKILQKKWASPKCFYKFQPLNLIRNYFGEAYALYFAWVGLFNFTLVFPMVIGIIFFCIGVANRLYILYYKKTN